MDMQPRLEHHENKKEATYETNKPTATLKDKMNHNITRKQNME